MNFYPIMQYVITSVITFHNHNHSFEFKTFTCNGILLHFVRSFCFYLLLPT